MKKRAAILANLIIVLMVFISWGSMVIGLDTGKAFTAQRLRSLKYFTVDSNLLIGIAALISILFQVRAIRKKKYRIPVWVRSLKLMGTASVTLTLMTVLLFLGPLFGYPAMFMGANLYLHLVIPLLAILTFCFLEKSGELKFRHTFIAVIPMLAYGTAYLSNILVNGVGEWPETNDWYGFTMWGIPASFLVYAVIAAATWLFAAALWKVNRRV